MHRRTSYEALSGQAGSQTTLASPRSQAQEPPVAATPDSRAQSLYTKLLDVQLINLGPLSSWFRVSHIERSPLVSVWLGIYVAHPLTNGVLLRAPRDLPINKPRPSVLVEVDSMEGPVSVSSSRLRALSDGRNHSADGR